MSFVLYYTFNRKLRLLHRCAIKRLANVRKAVMDTILIKKKLSFINRVEICLRKGIQTFNVLRALPSSERTEKKLKRDRHLRDANGDWRPEREYKFLRALTINHARKKICNKQKKKKTFFFLILAENSRLKNVCAYLSLLSITH